MVTGLSRNYLVAYDNIRLAIDPVRGAEVFGLSMITSRGRTVFIADTTINERPNAEQLAQIARQCAEKARALGHDPRVAFLSYANFGNPPGALASQVRDAVSILDDEGADRRVGPDDVGQRRLEVRLGPPPDGGGAIRERRAL